MPRHYLVFLLVSLFVLASCQSKNKENPAEFAPSGALPENRAAKGAAPAVAEPLPPLPINRQIIRNATLRFRVESIKVSSGRISGFVRKFGGLITASQENRSGNSLDYELTVRVPANRLDSFLDTLLKESIYTDAKTITADDVTKQYIDTEARIRSKKATEVKYLDLLKQAKNVAEVIEVENQLRQMREEIEVQETELRELKANVAMSRVSATLYELTDSADAPEAPFYVQIGHNLRDGLEMVGSFLIGVFYFLPLVALISVPLWLLIRWWHRRKRTTR